MRATLVLMLICFYPAPDAKDATSDPLQPPKREAQYAEKTVRRALFIENIKDYVNRDPRAAGRVLVLDWAMESYKRMRAKSINVEDHPDEFRKLVNAKLDEYDKKAKILANTSAFKAAPGTFKYMNLALDVIGSATGEKEKVATGGAKIGLELTKDIYEHFKGPVERVKAQDDFSEAKTFAEEIGGKAFDMGNDGKKYPAFDHIYDGAFEHEFGLKIRDSILTIYDKRVDLLNKHRLGATYDMNKEILDYIRQNFNPQTGKVTLKLDDLEGILKKNHRLTMDQITAIEHEIIQQFVLEAENTKSAKDDKVIDYLKEQEAKKSRLDQDNATANLKRRTAGAALDTLSFLAGMIDPEAGKGIATLGAFDLKMFDHFNQLLSDSKLSSGMAVTTFVGGVIGAIAALTSPGTDPSIHILNAIRDLHESLTHIAAHIDERFDNVDTKLSILFATMLNQYQELQNQMEAYHREQSIQIGELRIGLMAVHEELAGVASRLNRFEGNVYQYLADGFDRQFVDDLYYCLNNDLSVEKYKECLSKCVTGATEHAADTLQAGIVIEIPKPNERGGLDAETNETLFEQLSQKPFENNVNLIAAVAEAEGCLLVSDHSRIPNPVRWSICADAHFRLSSKWMSRYRKEFPEGSRSIALGSHRILNAGQRFANAVQRIGIKSIDGKEKGNLELFSRLVANYDTAADDFCSRLEGKRDRYRIPNVTARYNLWGKATQPTDFRPTIGVISPCKTAVKDVNLPILAAPPDLSDLIPDPMRAAVELGLGKVEFCYYQVSWVPNPALDTNVVREEDRNNYWLTSVRRYGKVNLGFVGLYNRRPFLWSSITSNKDLLTFSGDYHADRGGPGLRRRPQPDVVTTIAPESLLAVQWEAELKSRMGNASVAKTIFGHKILDISDPALLQYLKETQEFIKKNMKPGIRFAPFEGIGVVGGPFGKLFGDATKTTIEQLEKAAAMLTEESRKTIEAAASDVEAEFARHQELLNESIHSAVNGGSNDPVLNRSARALAGARMTLHAFVHLGLRRLAEIYPELKDFFIGRDAEKRLYDPMSKVQAGAKTVSFFGGATGSLALRSEIKKQIEEFESTLEYLLEKESLGSQSPAIVEESLDRLRSQKKLFSSEW